MIVPANPTRCSPDPTRLRFTKPSEAASARNAGPWIATSRGDLRSQRQGRPSESLDGAQHQMSTLRGLGRRPARPTEQRVRSGLSTRSRESSAKDAIMVYKRGNWPIHGRPQFGNEFEIGSDCPWLPWNGRLHGI